MSTKPTPRTVLRVIPALREDISDLQTYRAMPTSSLEMIDPFLFLNHHGYQTYLPKNHGLPFGPHPHRGFETATFILEGDISHKDSSGHESIIEAGGVQWMTAGSGLIHSEVSSEKFKNEGGPLEILQLWLNLPSRLKMTTPNYVGLQKDQIPRIEKNQGQVVIELVSGEFEGVSGAFKPLTDVSTMLIRLKAGTLFSTSIEASRSVFFYVIRGELNVNGTKVRMRNTLQLENLGEVLEIETVTDAIVLLCHAEPIGEPVVSYGPFVMNSREEINQAIKDYQAGKF